MKSVTYTELMDKRLKRNKDAIDKLVASRDLIYILNTLGQKWEEQEYGISATLYSRSDLTLTCDENYGIKEINLFLDEFVWNRDDIEVSDVISQPPYVRCNVKYIKPVFGRHTPSAIIYFSGSVCKQVGTKTIEQPIYKCS